MMNSYDEKKAEQEIACQKNPVIAGRGVCDPHLQLFEDRVYLYAGHDKDPNGKTFSLDDWQVWSTEDFVNWRPECVIRPEELYMGASDRCWAADAACANGKYYFYYSNGSQQTGVAVAEHPGGPYVDSANSPLLDGTLAPTPEYDPAIFQDRDGSFYIVFGGPVWYYGEDAGYYIAKLGQDMCSLAEAPRRIELDHEADDKVSLNRIGDTYYLTYASCYAVSDDVYGPYR